MDGTLHQICKYWRIVKLIATTKDVNWGDTAYYIEPERVAHGGVVRIGDVKEVNITKHGRVYNTCDYSRWGTRFYKETGIEEAHYGAPVQFFPTRNEAERRRKEYVLWMDMLRWHNREGGRDFSNFTDDELDTMISILEAVKE